MMEMSRMFIIDIINPKVNHIPLPGLRGAIVFYTGSGITRAVKGLPGEGGPRDLMRSSINERSGEIPDRPE
jgi:hypothetical protein